MHDVAVTYRKHGLVRNIEGNTQIRLPGTLKLQAGDSAVSLLQALSPVLLASGSDSLSVRHAAREPYGTGYFLVADQYIEGIPVIDSDVRVLLDTNGEIVKVVSSFVPKGKATTRPSITHQVAKVRVKEYLTATSKLEYKEVVVDEGSLQFDLDPTLGFWTENGQQETPILLWLIDVSFTSRGEPEAFSFGVDATTGEIRRSKKTAFGLNRTVWSNQYNNNLTPPTVHLWDEGQTGTDIQALEIYNRVMLPYQAWSGSPFLIQAVHLSAHLGTPGSTYADNSYARWLGGQRYMFFSDRRATDTDAIAHEFGHHNYLGWIQPPAIMSQFIEYDDWYAGNEFIADLSAVMTDIQQNGGGISTDTWKISEFRDWSNPKSKSLSYIDWYPSRWFFRPTVGTAYANSTVYGYGVYLMVNGGTHLRAGQWGLHGTIPVINVPASPWPTIKAVFIRTLFLMTLNGDVFTGPKLKQRTLQAATDLYGANSPVYMTVQSAWSAVGIENACSVPPTSPPVFSISSAYCKGRHTVSWPTISGVKYHAMAVQDPHGWLSAGATTVVDGTNTSCQMNVPQGPASRYRMRSCNACGCSGWSEDQWMQYYKPCL